MARDTMEMTIANPTGRLQAADVGTVFTFTCTDGTDVVDISMMNTKTLLIKKPDLTDTTKTLNFSVAGVDGKTTFTTAVTDFATPGRYQLQGYFVDSDGNKFHTNIICIDVYANLATP